MKRLISIFLVAIMLFGLVACTGNKGDETQTGGESDSQTGAALDAYDLSQFKIVRPSSSDTLVSQATSTLYQAMMDKGITMSLSDDWAASESDIDNESFEILIGETNRAATADALEELPENQAYIIRFYEKKIVIVAKSSSLLPIVVDYFIENYVSTVENNMLKVEKGTVYVGGKSSEVELLKKGVFLYDLVVGANADAAMKEAGTTLASKLKTLTGADITTRNDSTYYEEDCNIVLGVTSFKESEEAASSFGVNQYGVKLVGNKVIIFGHTADMLNKAVDQFISLVKDQVTLEDGAKTIVAFIPEETVNTNAKLLANVPMFDHGVYKGAYECGNDNVQMYFTAASSTKIDDYVSTLNHFGFVKKEDHTIGKNRYVTCVSDEGLVHVTYLDYNDSLTVIADPLTQTVYKESEPSYTKITDTTLAVSSLSYAKPEDGGGLSYVITLEDGRYIIIDGGYVTADAHGLYNFLVDNNKRTDRKIVIAAWIFTHGHEDHFGAFEPFSINYAKNVTVEYFIANPTSASMYSRGYNTNLDTKLPRLMSQYYKNAKLIKPHTGQILTFCNVAFQIMYTPANYAPGLLTSENNGSLIFRMTANGQTVLFTGDTEDATSNLVANMYGSQLKSDILQVPHHGAGGGTNSLYNAVKPTYTTWTTSQRGFELRTAGVKYDYISNSGVTSNYYLLNTILSGKTERCFVADGKVEIIKLPLTNISTDIEYYTPDFSKRS